MVLTVILLFFALLRFREKPPEIADNSVLVLRLEGEIPEKPPVELPSFLGGSRPRYRFEYLDGAAPRGRRPAHLEPWWVEPEVGAQAGLRSRKFAATSNSSAKSGKPVYAYPANAEHARVLRCAGSQAHSSWAGRTLCISKACAPKSCTSRSRSISSASRRRGTCRQVSRITAICFAHRHESGNARSDWRPGRQSIWKSGGANCRGPQEIAGEVRAIVDRGPFTASRALQEGLVDELRFEDQMWGELKQESAPAPSRFLPPST